ncbi:hypothetical protein SORBI_3004G305500 [Sorghum bicolor]|uniref:Uncharacterized protein n=1 Tax=Sorghum bicolor TaxID=4558 RepID=C5XSR0_SORBI|nr:hypothetical protein SORBI_3004G305500 [Sorghum bicolor]
MSCFWRFGRLDRQNGATCSGCSAWVPFVVADVLRSQISIGVDQCGFSKCRGCLAWPGMPGFCINRTEIKLLQKKKLIFYRCLCNSNCNDLPQSRSLYKYKLT